MGETIRSFLVGLGFDVDESSLAKFNKSLASATLRVTALYTAIQVGAVGVFKAVEGIAEGFEKLGYETRIIAPAISKTLELRKAMFEAYSRAGIDIVKVVKESIVFNMSLAKTKFALEAIYKSVGAKFIPVLTKQMDVFRKSIYANMPRIQPTLEKMVKFLLKAFDATVQLGMRVWSILGRVWDFFGKLDTATEGWSTKILLVVAAWKLLNLSFLASPIGLILTGFIALLALFDDFKTFQEGGQSLFNWSAALPSIKLLEGAIGSLFNAFKGIVDIVRTLFGAFQSLFGLNFKGFFDGIKASAEGVFGVLSNLGGVLKGVAGAAAGLGGIVGNYLGNKLSGPTPNALPAALSNPNAGTALNGLSQPNPLLAQNNGVNQKVSQETNINVQGSADANATAKAVSSEQGKVNFDLTRNLRGSTR